MSTTRDTFRPYDTNRHQHAAADDGPVRPHAEVLSPTTKLTTATRNSFPAAIDAAAQTLGPVG